jgi:hypothetical protein
MGVSIHASRITMAGIYIVKTNRRQESFGTLTPLIRQNTRSISELEFCRALHDYSGNAEGDLGFKKGAVMAILSRFVGEDGRESGWCRGRLQNGSVGMFPGNYVERIERKGVPGSGDRSGVGGGEMQDFTPF